MSDYLHDVRYAFRGWRGARASHSVLRMILFSPVEALRHE
jgi:hypothetical protein